jgi:hypothetical protein
MPEAAWRLFQDQSSQFVAEQSRERRKDFHGNLRPRVGRSFAKPRSEVERRFRSNIQMSKSA